jgi:hypothetical protein
MQKKAAVEGLLLVVSITLAPLKSEGIDAFHSLRPLTILSLDTFLSSRVRFDARVEYK